MLGFELAPENTPTFELDTDAALEFAEPTAKAGLGVFAVARVGLGIFDCVLTIPRVWEACLFLLRTSPIEDPSMPTSARVPIIHASAWMVRLT